jgi:hypothetical protein
MRSLYSLPFVLPERVIYMYEDVIMIGFLTIKDSSHPLIVANKGNIEKYVAYLKATWVGRPTARQEQDPVNVREQNMRKVREKEPGKVCAKEPGIVRENEPGKSMRRSPGKV